MIIILIKLYANRQHSQHKTGCCRIRKNRSSFFCFLRFFCMFLLNDLSKSFNRVVCNQLLFRLIQFRILFQHIRLHLRIFFIINIISTLSQQSAIVIAEKSLLFFYRIHQHKHFFSAKKFHMDPLHAFCHFHLKRFLRQEPPYNFLPCKIVFCFLMKFLPCKITELYMLCRNLPCLCRQSSPDKQIACT